MRPLFIVVRVLGFAAIVAAVIAQLLLSLDFWAGMVVEEIPTKVVNFFSFFTIQSNIAAAVTFAIGAVLLIVRRAPGDDPGWFTVLRACVTSYMVTTGIVYNLLLRGIELPQGLTLPWSNEVLHVVGPLLVLVDWLFAPGRGRLEWRTIGIIVIYPLVWAVYTMVRGPFIQVAGAESWYPYPFLNPDTSDNGYLSVAFYVILIALVIGAVGAGVVAISRRRRKAEA